MSGSKKGERRGGRKKGTLNRATVEKRRQLAIALGYGDLYPQHMPRDVLMDVMNRLYDLTLKWAGETDRYLEEGDQEAAVQAQAQYQQMLIMTGDQAYKAANFIHPRFSAVAVANSDKSHTDVVAALLQEVNRSMRERPGLLINAQAEQPSETEH